MPVTKHTGALGLTGPAVTGHSPPGPAGTGTDWAHPRPQRAGSEKRGCSVTDCRGTERGRKGLKEARHPQPHLARPGPFARPSPTRPGPQARAPGAKCGAQACRRPLASPCHAMPCSAPCPGRCPGRTCSSAGATSRPGPAQLRLLRQHPPAPPLHNMAAAPAPARGTTGARPARHFEHIQEAAARGAMATAPLTSQPGHDVMAGPGVCASVPGGHRARTAGALRGPWGP